MEKINKRINNLIALINVLKIIEILTLTIFMFYTLYDKWSSFNFVYKLLLLLIIMIVNIILIVFNNGLISIFYYMINVNKNLEKINEIKILNVSEKIQKKKTTNTSKIKKA